LYGVGAAKRQQSMIAWDRSADGHRAIIALMYVHVAMSDHGNGPATRVRRMLPANGASSVTIRRAASGDLAAVANLVEMLAQSFPFARERFGETFPTLLTTDHACLLVAVDGDSKLVGYLLGFRHHTFYAGGPVASVEEILTREDVRGRGIGRALMSAFERWAMDSECAVVSLATRRAEAFYLAIGYQNSASYLRKVLSQPG